MPLLVKLNRGGESIHVVLLPVFLVEDCMCLQSVAISNSQAAACNLVSSLKASAGCSKFLVLPKESEQLSCCLRMKTD